MAFAKVNYETFDSLKISKWLQKQLFIAYADCNTLSYQDDYHEIPIFRLQ